MSSEDLAKCREALTRTIHMYKMISNDYEYNILFGMRGRIVSSPALFKEELSAASYSPIASAIHLQLRCRIASLMDTLTTKPQMLLDVPWAWKVTRKQSLLWYSKILEES